MRVIRMAGVVALLFAVSGMALQAKAQNPKKAKAEKPSPQSYCTSTGGVVETRYAAFGTNNPQQDWLLLSGVQAFCRYPSATDGSRIHLALDTLYSTKPTLAALAYTQRFRGTGRETEIRPRTIAQSWAERKSVRLMLRAEDGFLREGLILEACIFPDNSTIDSWGLFYHSDAIIRGIDLSTVLKYPNPYAGKK